MFRYRMHLADRSDAGEATYAQMIHPGDEIHVSARPAVPCRRPCPVRWGGRVAVSRAATGRSDL